MKIKDYFSIITCKIVLNYQVLYYKLLRGIYVRKIKSFL